MNNEQTDIKFNQGQMHRACIVDEHGNEVPITQDMIDRAVKVLESCLSPFACYQGSKSAT